MESNPNMIAGKELSVTEISARLRRFIRDVLDGDMAKVKHW